MQSRGLHIICLLRRDLKIHARSVFTVVETWADRVSCFLKGKHKMPWYLLYMAKYDKLIRTASLTVFIYGVPFWQVMHLVATRILQSGKHSVANKTSADHLCFLSLFPGTCRSIRIFFAVIIFDLLCPRKMSPQLECKLIHDTIWDT